MTAAIRARAAILGCAGPTLTASEARFFADADPWAFILFGRNVVDPDQVRRLCADLRACVGREALVFVDQEGGRVQRLGPPHWRARPPARVLGKLYQADPAAGREATTLAYRLIAEDLRAVGVTADCIPVLDVPAAGADPIIGDRAFASDPETVAILGRAALAGAARGGVAGDVKHIPGHGRAGVDSHLALPVVETPAADLARVDFAPFRALADAPMAMTAHVVYTAFDPDRPATLSKTVIDQVIRGDIGFDGLLMTDDLSMKALAGAMRERCETAVAAGCDMLLHCNGDMAEMEAVVAAAPRLEGVAADRAGRAEAAAVAPDELDHEREEARLAALLPTDGGAGRA